MDTESLDPVLREKLSITVEEVVHAYGHEFTIRILESYIAGVEKHREEQLLKRIPA